LSAFSRTQPSADECGSSTVEAVLVIPVVMLILLTVIQFALWAHASEVTQLSAAAGDRVARSVNGDSAGGVAEAEAVLARSGSDVQSGSAVASVAPGDEVRITVTGSALSILPGLSLPVSATQVGPIQEFRGSE
jgi:hypothetical protein